MFRKVCDILFIAGCTGPTSKYVFLKKKYSFIVKIFFSPFFFDSFKYLQYGILVAILFFYKISYTSLPKTKSYFPYFASIVVRMPSYC